MAKKKVAKIIKLQIPAGKATPAPPIGPALGSAGVNIMKFCQDFNKETQSQIGDILPVVITVFVDKSFTFVTKTPPMAEKIKKNAGITSGSKVPNRDKVGNITLAQAEAIAREKMADMNAATLDAAVRMVMGTARSMGVTVSG